MQILSTTIKRSIIAVVCTALLPFFIFARKTSDPATHRNIYLTPPGKKITVTVALKAKPHSDSRKIYYWLDHDNVQHTQGGYSGYLLDGEYVELSYPDNQLAAKGMFENGLMHGTWVKWYSNGYISEKASWKKGVLHGHKYYYNNSGQPLKTEVYRYGKMIREQILVTVAANPEDSTQKESRIKHLLTIIRHKLHLDLQKKR